jgi:hypothetical protein
MGKLVQSYENLFDMRFRETENCYFDFFVRSLLLDQSIFDMSC